MDKMINFVSSEQNKLLWQFSLFPNFWKAEFTSDDLWL